MAQKQIKGGREPGRNEPCQCGSGLKFKKCHGDPVLRQTAQRIANHMITLLIVERSHEAGIANAEETMGAIDKLVNSANDHLPDSVRFVTNYDVEEPAEPEPDKLEQKELEGRRLDDLQADTWLCVCGRRLPLGMQCAKCKITDD